MINPDNQTATEIARLLEYPGFLKRESFAKGRTEIVELRIGPDSKLCNVSLMSLHDLVKCKVLVCAVQRDGKCITPRGDFVLKEGDRIFVTAPTQNLATLLRNLNIITRRVRRCLLCGGSRLAYHLAKNLDKTGIDVTIVEQDPARCHDLATQLPNVNVIQGDGNDQSLLESLGLSDMDALVSLTGSDELNMIISLYAQTRQVPQVITKLRRTANREIIDALELGSVVSPKETCSSIIARYVRAMQNQVGAAISVHAIADGQAEASEFIVDGNTRHCNTPLKDIKLKPGVLLASITRDGKTEIPSGMSTFRKGDCVVVVTVTGKGLHQFNDIFA